MNQKTPGALNIPPAADGRIVFIDTEFTSLDRDDRRVWEIGAIVRDPGTPDREVEWQIRPDLSGASPDSLRIGRYYRRSRVLDRPVGSGLVVVHPDHGEDFDVLPEQDRRTNCEQIAACLAPILDGAFLVGAVVSADDIALDGFMRRWGQALTSHYRLKCVETLAQGFVHGVVAERATVPGREVDLHHLVERIPAAPYDPKTLSRLVGVEPPPPETLHRALVDARWARDVWDAVHRGAAAARAVSPGQVVDG